MSMSRLESLESLLVDGLKDLLDAEKKLVEALPAMAKMAATPQLRAEFHEHIGRTEEHIVRLLAALHSLGAVNLWKRCAAMECLIDSTLELANDDAAGPVTDAALIGSVQKIVHYEMAAYGTAKTYAEEMDYDDVASLMGLTLEEEHGANDRFARIAEDVVNMTARDHEEPDIRN